MTNPIHETVADANGESLRKRWLRRIAVALLIAATGTFAIPWSRDWVLGMLAGERTRESLPLRSWLRLARTGNEAERQEAVAAIVELDPQDERVVPALTDAARDPDSLVRKIAAEALGRLGSAAQASVAVLGAMLKDVDPYVRLAAARALGQIREMPETVVPLLQEVVRSDAEPAPRVEAIVALGKYGNHARTAIPLLTHALLEPAQKGEDVALAAAVALQQIGADAIPALEEACRSKIARVRSGAVQVLAGIGEPARGAVPIFRSMLKDTDWGVKVEAAKALWRFEPGAQEVAPTLAAALSGPRAVRGPALFALGEIGAGAEGAVKAMAACLRDTDYTVRRTAATALGKIGPAARDAIDELEYAIKNDIEPDVRRNATEALEAIRQSPVTGPKS